MGREDVRRLMTIPGVDSAVTLALVAAIGDIARFASPPKLVSYFGLDPRGARCPRPGCGMLAVQL